MDRQTNGSIRGQDRDDANASAGLGPDDEGIGNIRPSADSDATGPDGPNVEAGLGPEDEGLGNIRLEAPVTSLSEMADSEILPSR